MRVRTRADRPLPAPAPSWLMRIGDKVALAAASVGLVRWARVVAVALVPLLVPEGRFGALWVPFVWIAIYALLAAVAGKDLLPRYGDLLAAAGLVLLLGPDVLPFMPFLLVAVAGPAARMGLLAGVAAGGTLASLLLLRLVAGGELALVGLPEILPIAVTLPVGGVTVGAAAQLLRDRDVRDRLVLQRANRVLSALRDLADDLPGGLDVPTVSAALLDEVEALPGVRAVIVYADDDGTVRPSASTGLGQSPLPTLRIDELRTCIGFAGRLLTPATLPAPLSFSLRGHLHWVVQPLGEGDDPAGAILVGGAEAHALRQAMPHLQASAVDGALALRNARLFDVTRSRAADAARRWVAADLHDGVAQSLAHLRMELELRAREQPDDEELRRLTQVADSALHDLRVTIGGLRTPAGTDLQARLRRHVAQVQGRHGPRLHLDVEDGLDLTGDQADGLLRIAQEAISNALRHAAPTVVEVSVAMVDGEVRLRVADDGSGGGQPSGNAGGGVGLRTMRERAQRLGGSFGFAPGGDGGSVVTVGLPAGGRRDDRRGRAR